MRLGLTIVLDLRRETFINKKLTQSEEECESELGYVDDLAYRCLYTNIYKYILIYESYYKRM